MKKLKFLLSILVVQCCMILICVGQGGTEEAPSGLPNMDIISSSPTAASLGKYGNMPVSLYSGTPNISIPLWTVQSRELTVPISLSYHASGIKVSDMAGWVGLGWALNAGGVVTRNLKGLPDELSNKGYLKQKFIPGRNDLDYSYLSDFLYLDDVSQRKLDTEPDVFSFNFNGYSGKFIFKNNGEAYLLTHQNFRIKWDHLSQVFTIIAPDGTIYVFATTESTRTTEKALDANIPLRQYVSSWYLSEVISSNHTDTIRFEYGNSANAAIYYCDTEIFKYPYNFNSTPECDFMKYTHEITPNFQFVTTKNLTKIIFPHGEIEFLSSTGRPDNDDLYKLDRINILNNNKEIKKSFSFEYGSYSGNDGLKLDKLYELGESESLVTCTKPPYIFDYDEQLPDRLSLSQDHWGFYNGASNGARSSLLPSYNNGSITFNGADRETNPSYVTAGMINSITYPTGGETEFKFESNEVRRETILYETIYQELYVNLTAENVQAGTTSKQDSKIYNYNEDMMTVFSVTFRTPVGFEYENYDDTNGIEMTYELKDNNQIIKSGVFNIHNYADELLRIDADAEFETNIQLVEDVELLQGHEYEISLTNDFIIDKFDVSAELSWYENDYTNQIYDKYIGGVRVKEIKDYPTDDSNDFIIKSYKYTKSEGSSESSGQMVNTSLLKYSSINKIYFVAPLFQGGFTPDSDVENEYLVSCYCNELVLSTNSSSPILSSGGNAVGYTTVTEYIGTEDQNIGKTVYRYNFRKDDVGPYPLGEVTSWEAVRGKLLSKKDYKFSEGQYKSVKEEQYKYDFYSDKNFNTIYNLKVQKLCTGDVRNRLNHNLINEPVYNIRNPFKYTKWITLDTLITKIYDETDPSKYTQTRKVYNYESKTNTNPTKVTTYNSDGSINIRKMKYVQNNSFDTGDCLAEINDDCDADYYEACYKNRTTCRKDVESCILENDDLCLAQIREGDSLCDIAYESCILISVPGFSQEMIIELCASVKRECHENAFNDFDTCMAPIKASCEAEYNCENSFDNCMDSPSPCLRSQCTIDKELCLDNAYSCLEAKKIALGVDNWYDSLMTVCESIEDIAQQENCFKNTPKAYIRLVDSLLNNCKTELGCDVNFADCKDYNPYEYCVNEELKTITDPDLQLIGQMQLNNITTPVVESSVYYKENEYDQEKLISSSYTTYKDFDPTSGFNIKGHKVDKTNNAAEVINFKEVKIENGKLTRDVQYYQEEAIIDKYDEFGNILQYHTKQGNYTCYVWGYNNTYPIAKVDNIEYTQIQNLLGTTSLNQLNTSSVTDATIENILGTLRDELENSFVSIYTYDPVYGHITSATDPNGLKTQYTYDHLGRLELVKDDDENILEKNTYFYKWDEDIHGEHKIIICDHVTPKYIGDPKNDLLIETTIRNISDQTQLLEIVFDTPFKTIVLEDSIMGTSTKDFVVTIPTICLTEAVAGNLRVNGEILKDFTIEPCSDYEACLLELIPCDSIFTGEGLVCPFGDASIFNCSLPQGFIGRSRVDVNSTWTDWVKNDLKVSKDGQGIDYLWEIKKDCYTYGWNTSSWEPSCQGCTNYQTRDIWCERIETGDVMSDTWCSETKPAYTSACTHEKPANIVNINIQYNVINDSEVVFTIDLLNIGCSNSSGEVMVELIGPDAGSHVNDIVSQITIDSQASETLTGTFLAAKPIDAYCQIKVTYNGVEKLTSQFVVGEVQ